MDRTAWHDHLSPFLPEAAVRDIVNWIIAHDVEFVVHRHRKTKLGDFRPPHRSKRPRITVNESLNPYAFLITTVHEFAHLEVYSEHKNRVAPHGPEWKSAYSEMLKPFVFDDSIFPEPLFEPLLDHLQRPKATSCTDLKLYRKLREFDSDPKITAESLRQGDVFRIGNRILLKGPKLRTRFKCKEPATGRYFMVHPLAEVERVTNF